MAVNFYGLIIGDDGTGFKVPTYAALREVVAKQVRQLRGKANLHTEPGSLYGTFIDIALSLAYLALQGASEAVSRTVFQSMGGVSLDQFLADYMTRIVATPSTATVFVYGTAGTVVPASTGVATSANATPYTFIGAVVLPAAPAEAYGIEVENFVAGKYAGQAFTVTVDGTPVVFVPNVGDDGTTTRNGLVNAINFYLLTQLAYLAGQSPTNGRQTLVVSETQGGGPFPLTVNGPVGAIVAYVANSGATTTDPVTGPTYAPAESLRVGDPIAGVQGYVNIEDALLGLVRETDSQLKARFQIAQRGLGGGSPDAIRAIILASVAAGGGGASYCAVEYNPTDDVDDAGNLPHSVRVVVDDAVSGQDVGNALWRAKAAGDNTNGPEVIAVLDNGQPPLAHDIRIDRLVDLWIACDMSVQIGPDWPTSGTPTDQLRQDVADYVEALQPSAIGVRVVDLPIALYPNGLPRGVKAFVVRLGYSLTQGGPYTYLPYYPDPEENALLASVVMTSRQKARCQIGDVTAVIV